MASLQEKWEGLVFCLLLAVPSWFLGKMFPIIGGAAITIVAGMTIAIFMKNKDGLEDGVKFTSKKVLQWAIIPLKFGVNLSMVLETGKQSLSVIACTIATSLVIAFALYEFIYIPSNISTLMGTGSSTCGGSTVVATAPVINADDDEVAQAISMIFPFNILTAILFPTLGKVLGFDTAPDNAFGVPAGTAISDTSPVTTTAAAWDSMWNSGAATLNKAVTVKLARTLAIIPITLCLTFIRTRKEEKEDQASGQSVSFKNIFPFFILYFIGASVITTIATEAGIPISVFTPIKGLNRFFIILAMAAIGLNTNLVKLTRTSGKPMPMGVYCWVRVTAVSLGLRSTLGIW